MKKLSRIEMKKVIGGLVAPDEACGHCTGGNGRYPCKLSTIDNKTCDLDPRCSLSCAKDPVV